MTSYRLRNPFARNRITDVDEIPVKTMYDNGEDRQARKPDLCLLGLVELENSLAKNASLQSLEDYFVFFGFCQ
jgi:hypothetical protein